jgi:hypothetical protein
VRIRRSRQFDVMWVNPVRCEVCTEWMFPEEPHECPKVEKEK